MKRFIFLVTLLMCVRPALQAQTPAPPQSFLPVTIAPSHPGAQKNPGTQQSARTTEDDGPFGTPYPNKTTVAQWHAAIGSPYEDWAYSIVETDQKNLIGVGYSTVAGIRHPAIFKLSSKGQLIWAQTTTSITHVSTTTGSGGIFTKVIKAPGGIYIAVGYAGPYAPSGAYEDPYKQIILAEFNDAGTYIVSPTTVNLPSTYITGSTSAGTLNYCSASSVALDPVQNSAAHLIISGQANFGSGATMFNAAFIATVDISGTTPVSNRAFIGGENNNTGGNVLTTIITKKTSATTYDIYSCGYKSASSQDNETETAENASGILTTYTYFDKDGWLVKLQMANPTSAPALSLTNQWQFNKDNITAGPSNAAISSDHTYLSTALYPYQDIGPCSARNFFPKTPSGGLLPSIGGVNYAAGTYGLTALFNVDERVSDMVMAADGSITMIVDVNNIGNSSNGATSINNGQGLLTSGTTPDGSSASVVGEYGEYRDCDAFIVKVDPNNYTATTYSGQNVAHFSGSDFSPTILQDKMGRYIIGGSTADNYPGSTDPINLPASIPDQDGDGESAFIVCTDDAHISSHATDIWRREFVADDPREGGDNEDCMCLFGMACTADDGYVIVGNNDNGSAGPGDWSITKFAPINENTLPAGISYSTFGLSTVPAQYTLPTGTTTLSTNLNIATQIIVPNGATLNVTNCTIQFASSRNVYDYFMFPSPYAGNLFGVGVIVQPGGKVNISHSTLRGMDFPQTAGTGTDRNMWDGIVVLGTPTVPYPANQGVVTIKNSKIEDAVYGFYVADNYRDFINSGTVTTSAFTGNTYTSGYTGYGDLGGGIVTATTDTFIDNRWGFNFQGYTGSPNVSGFTGCYFNTDASGMGDICLYTDANGNNLPAAAYGLSWEGFITAKDNIFTCDLSFPASGRSIGLGGVDARLNITRSCSLYGTDGLCSLSPGPGNTFNNLSTAVMAGSSMAQGAAGATITYNTFNNNTVAVAATGLTSSLQITSNNVNVPSNSTGFTVNNCVGYEVALNTFNGYNGTSTSNDFGIVVSNESLTNDEVVQNNYFSNYRAPAVALGYNGGSGIHGLQFRCNDFDQYCYSGINRFTYFLGVTDPTYDNSTLASQQGYCSGSLTSPAGNQFRSPCYGGLPERLYADPGPTLYQPNINYYNNAASTIFDPVGCIQPSYTDIACTPAGGAITGSAADITAACPPPATGYSLSDNTNAIGTAHALESSMREAADAGDNDTYNELEVEHNLTISYVARYYSFTGQYETGGEWLENYGEYAQALSFYLEANDAANAERMERYLDGGDSRLAAGNSQNANADEENADFATIARMTVSLRNAGKSWLDLDSTDRSVLHAMAKSNSRAGYLAAFTDTLLGGGPMLWPTPVINTDNEGTGMPIQPLQNAYNTQGLNNEFSIYPNPSAGAITIKATHSGTFYLYNMLGQQTGAYIISVGQTNINISANLAAGVYTGKYLPDNGSASIQTRIVLNR